VNDTLKITLMLMVILFAVPVVVWIALNNADKNNDDEDEKKNNKKK